MRRCPDCGERLKGDPDRYGARCPACRGPLYDDPPGRDRGLEDGRCAVHPENPARGTCARCGNYLCAVCRTRWRDRWLCTACADRALERNEAVPAEASAHLRQALLSLGLGVGSWVIFLFGMLLAGAAVSSGGPGLVILVGLLVMVSPVPAVIGVGQGAAAIRARGDHMILATLGLVLSGLNVGSVIGLLSFGFALQT
ncbi:MAG TPA: hypothetical protein VKA46_35480 [Gemmataceae bacterium]|nr:hypothetical protein [Gemmataceae bacterium]